MTIRKENQQRPSEAARAEAAAWVARLHGPHRSREVEAGLHRWLADDPENAAAFELLTDTWEKSARLRRRPMERVTSWQLVGFRVSFSRAALATVATFAVAVLATLLYLRTNALSTGIGELRTVTLDEGTRIHLNTNTRVVVEYDRQTRLVRLDRGEALFEVAARPGWPFVVIAGGRRITALGTQFVVRRDQQDLAVTLVEGKVAVAPSNPQQDARQPPQLPTAPSSPSSNRDRPEIWTLTPGERVTFERSGSGKLDHPALDNVMAWERGQVAFDNTSLADAVAEMNRYSHERLVIEDPSVAAIRISGVFQAGNLTSFSRALALAYHLRVRKDGNEIDLGAPAQQSTFPGH
jgi:transmembrane sensor